MGRGYDDLHAYTLKLFLESPDLDPELFDVFPMAKSVLQATKAVKEFTVQKDMVDENVGFIPIGGSKHGHLTWMVSVADRPDLFPPIVATIPMVPIIPAMVLELHRMY